MVDHMPFKITSYVRHEGDRVSVIGQNDSSRADFAEFTLLFSFAHSGDIHGNLDVLIRDQAKAILRTAAEEI